MDIKEVYTKYSRIDIGDLSNNQKDFLYNTLRKAKPEDLHTIEEHRMFVEVLQKFRLASIRDMERVGAKFLDTLKSLLAVGEDGVYSNSLRFIYELIQNVDDCDYDSVEDCRLDIQFKYHTSPGKIVLTYNEKGFTPENVFAITGIAEKSKNISAEKGEIGEKGIGFKSVFGIADKVYIESGSFSFELYRDSFTVPVPRYDGFQPVEGTRLTLEMPDESVKMVYRKLVEQYVNGDAALNQNPILFLNKLTHLKMYFDAFRYIEFNVKRKTPEWIDDIAFEDDVTVSVDMMDHDSGQDVVFRKDISCRRYTQPIVFHKDECESRYGKDAPFSERHHNLIALFPEQRDELKNFKGRLYSFLPTQVHLNAPIVLHVPFKLDGSREFIDPQGENLWFSYTVEALAEFLKKSYLHLASIVKQGIVFYLPYRQQFLFQNTNEKVQSLLRENLKGDTFCMEKVFYTEDGSFEDAGNIVAFAKDEEYEDQSHIYSLLGERAKLFVPLVPTDMRLYGVRIISNAPSILFKRGLRNEESFSEIARVLDAVGGELKYTKLIEECCPVCLTRKQLHVINNHRKILTGLNEYVHKCIDSMELPQITFDESLTEAPSFFRNELEDMIVSADLDYKFEEYLKEIGYRIVLIDEIKQEFVIAGQESIVLSEGNLTGSFASLVSKYDPRRVFVAQLQIRQASNKLNDADESMSDEEYLKLLRSVRSSLKNAFGTRMYNNYIQIINKAGIDKGRFLNELLQNADDCYYQEDEEPSFDLELQDNTITVTYNESGFTKQNVRAITAIGESTKNLLLNGNEQSIGEKGVGFKSVFGVAESVEIHSNGFDFRLTDKTPTIPEKCDPLEEGNKQGTTLIFSMKTDIRKSLKPHKILGLCLCLRKLKRITIQGTEVVINDSENERIISIGNRVYCYEKFKYQFSVSDSKAIEERSANHKKVGKTQRIVFYLPSNNKNELYPLYSGLPTLVNCNIPLIIDAPFELTTSRDNVLENRWNDIIRNQLYNALIALMREKRSELKIDVFKYVKMVSQNNAVYYQTFSEPYLNFYDLSEALSKAALMPVLDKEKFISSKKNACIILPDVIIYASRQFDVSKYYKGTLIDTFHKSQYLPILENLGCIRSSIESDLNCIRQVSEKMIRDAKFRDALYGYLSSPATQARVITSGRMWQGVKDLPIYPIRKRSGVEYVPFSKNIYTHASMTSDKDFLILDTEIMKYETLQAILGGTERINELSQEVYDARYQNNLIGYIRDPHKSNKEKAAYTLDQFLNNRTSFQRCHITLRGMIDEIPMLMISGNYQIGKKFVNKRNLKFAGKTISDFIVADSFKALAEYLGCKDVLEIHYDEIDMDVKSLSNEDIEDFQSEFKYYAELLEGFYNDGIITDEQIEKYNLHYLIASSDDEDFEEFPGKPVSNLQRLRKHVRQQFLSNPNPYVKRTRTVHEPKNPVNKEAYTTSMYGSEESSQKCFCQMCTRKVPNHYIERNDVLKNPKYGWAQMYLSLCLTCSKDYILLRNNQPVWEKFVKDIVNCEIGTQDVVTIDIGNREITFTATHLAEIQAILEIELDEIN